MRKPTASSTPTCPTPPPRTESSHGRHAERRYPRRPAEAFARRSAGAAHHRRRVQHLHGSAGHDDRQRRGAAHRRQPRREPQRRHLDDQLVRTGQRDHAAAHRLAGAPFRRGENLRRLGAAVRDLLDAVRPGHQHADAGDRPPAAGRRLRADGGAFADFAAVQLPEGKTGHRTGAMGHDRGGGADLRPDPGRLADRQFLVAVDFLHQSARGHSGGGDHLEPAAQARDQDLQGSDRHDRAGAAGGRRGLPAVHAGQRQRS